jgi:hypothetical protein
MYGSFSKSFKNHLEKYVTKQFSHWVLTTINNEQMTPLLWLKNRLTFQKSNRKCMCTFS